MGGEDFDISIIFPPAMLGRKRKSDAVCTVNNQSLWWKQSKTKIMQSFKNTMKEWYLPKWEDNPYRWADIHFTILRTNNVKMDSDSLSSGTYKWTIDILTEQGYLVDDDQCRVILNPTQLGVEGTLETLVKMQVKFHERCTMTIDELRAAVDRLREELDHVGGPDHVKAASGRARKILGDIKNATPQLRRDLVKLDKM